MLSESFQLFDINSKTLTVSDNFLPNKENVLTVSDLLKARWYNRDFC